LSDDVHTYILRQRDFNFLIQAAPKQYARQGVVGGSSMISSRIRLNGLNKKDQLELTEHLPQESFHVDPIANQARHGEPTTTLVITLAVPVLSALATWLLKDRTLNEEERTVEIVRADGSIHRETVRKLKQMSTSKPGLIAALAKLCRIELPPNQNP
jgi:hypothetical protein